MLSVQCPGCRQVFSAPDLDAGAVLTCSHCGRRLRLPNAAHSAAGSTQGSASLTSPPRPEERPAFQPYVRVETIDGEEFLAWPCSFCQAPLRLRRDEGSLTLRCPSCGREGYVPRLPAAGKEPILFDPAPAAPEGPRLAEEIAPRAARPGPSVFGRAVRGLVCGIISLVLFLVDLVLVALGGGLGPQNISPGLGILGLIILLIALALGFLGAVHGLEGRKAPEGGGRGVGTAGLVVAGAGLLINSGFGVFLVLKMAAAIRAFLA